MKSIFAIIAGITIFTSCALSKPQFEPVTVIELFTSQGCSSCPSADKLLSQTITDAKKDGKKIFALSFHVDYWNRLGWADPFSERKYTERQNNYAQSISGSSVYTPQMVVNGDVQFVGSNQSELNSAIKKSLSKPSIVSFKNLTATYSANSGVHVQYNIEGEVAGSVINFALVSLSETTNIKRGENEGRTLKNENVVRQFVSQRANASGQIDFALSPMPDKSNCAVVAYLQHENDSKVIGAAMTTPK